MKNTAIYAFSADPITFGHMDIIKRAKKAFDRLIVGIGTNPVKKYTFTKSERLELAREALKDLNGIEVDAFEGTLSDYAYEQNARYIIRGLRNGDDFNFELMLHQINQTQAPEIDMFLLPCSQNKAHISSSAAKAIQLEQGLIQEYVPLNVKKALESKISGQRIIGVTGTIASGKSTFCRNLVKWGVQNNIPTHHIDIDRIGCDILESSDEPVYRNIRKEIIEKFGDSVSTPTGTIDRKALGRIVFENPLSLEELNTLMRTPIITVLRRRLYGLRGVILVEGALLVEGDLTSFCNHEVVVLNVSKTDQVNRLRQRGFNSHEIKLRINSQFSYQQKLSQLQQLIESAGLGQILKETNVADFIFKDHSLNPSDLIPSR